MYEATRVPLAFIKEGTMTGSGTGAACSPLILRWTHCFNLEAEMGMVLEAGMEGAMVGSPAWMAKVMRVGMVGKEK